MREITGTVTYWERIALPPDALVHVALSAVGPAGVIAEVTEPANGAQVPIAFVLAYPEAAIDEGLTYIVDAEIRVDGRAGFITSAPVEVLTGGRPEHDVAIRVHVAV